MCTAIPAVEKCSMLGTASLSGALTATGGDTEKIRLRSNGSSPGEVMRAAADVQTGTAFCARYSGAVQPQVGMIEQWLAAEDRWEK